MFVQALEWVVGDAIMNGNIYKSVANISSGGPKTVAMNQAIAAAVRVGLVVVVAAGNDGVRFCFPCHLFSRDN
jgi:subtilisin family serine protease